MLIRMESVGLARDGCFGRPLTQSDLKEALGLSHVHMNRIVQRLRSDGLIE